MTKTSRLLFALGIWLAAMAGGALGQVQKFPAEAPYAGYGGGYGPGAGPYDGYANMGEGAGPFSGAVSMLHMPIPGTFNVSLNGAVEGLGYEGSYASFHGVVPIWTGHKHSWWVIDARGSLSEDAEPFANIGIVRRTYFSPMCADIGLGVFYDYDGDQYDTFGHDFHQVGVSGHFWTQYFDLDINGYLPVGDTSHVVTSPFFQNSLVIRPGFDIALEGWDMSVALRPNFLAQKSGTFHLGGYAYSSDIIEPFGGFQFAFDFQPKAGLTLGAQLTSDDEFDTTGLFTLAWNWGSSRGYSPSGRDLDPIRRNAHIVRTHQDPIFAVNPVTGLNYRVVHVDNSNNNNGNGTFENPYNELADADGTIGGDSAAGDIIFVHTGLSTDIFGNPANLAGYNAGIGLLNNQLLLGDGVAHTVATTQGNYTFSLNEDGLVPTITNFGGNVVTLADFNTVSGLSIQGFGSGNIGISDDGTGATDTLIDTVVVQGFSGATGFGVRIAPSINTTIVNSTITGNNTDIFLNATNTTIDNTVVGNSNIGISLNNVQGTTRLTNITAISPVGTAIEINNQFAGSTTTIENATITSNTGSGIVLDNNEGSIVIDDADIATREIAVDINNSNVVVQNSTLSSLDNSVIRVQHSGAIAKTVTIENNVMVGADRNSEPPAVQLVADGNAGVPLLVNLFGNTIFSAPTNVEGVATTGGGGMVVNIEDNSFQSTGGLAVDLGADVQVGTNFLASTRNGAAYDQVPAQTMGSVSDNHVVELIGTSFAVFDKSGNELQRVTDEQFWTNAGATGVGFGVGETDTTNNKIVYDPQSGRWFAVSSGRGAGNQVFVARSDTSDPTGTWQAVQFVGDTGAATLNETVGVGIDQNGLYFTTNNYTAGVLTDRSVYSIPKADLIAAVPSVANMTRNENLVSIGTMQGVYDFEVSDGRATLLAADGAGDDILQRRNILGIGAAGAILSAGTILDVDPYDVAPDGAQPGLAVDLENENPNFTASAVEVGDDIWTVHTVADPDSGRSAIRWYRIDESTSTIEQSGTIADAELDFLYPSIAVNAAGDVVIGMTGSGEARNPSAMAVVGSTAGGTTVFRTPEVLALGNGNYEVFQTGTTRNRWGNYSATWVDPSDPTRFWTFQERTAAVDDWGTQITEIILQPTPITVNSFLNNNVVEGEVILP